MKIILKNLKCEIHSVEIATNCSVETLIRIAHQLFKSETDQIKLIHQGTNLNPSQNVDFYQIKEGDSIICMMLKEGLLEFHSEKNRKRV